MADSDYDRDDDRRRDDDRGDDRPRRRRDDDGPPKKKGKGMVILLVVLGAVLLLCVAPCGIGGYWLFQQTKAVIDLAEGFMGKVGSGDIAGAYAQTSPTFKTRYTQEQFGDNMKKARLTEYQSMAWSNTQSSTQNNSGSGEMKGTATLKDGTTVPVTLKITFDGKSWSIDDVITTGGGTTTPPTTK